MHVEPSDELQDRLKNFDSHLKTLEAKRAKQVELREKEGDTTKDLRNREHRLAMNHGSLIGKRTVSPVWYRLAHHSPGLSAYITEIRRRRSSSRGNCQRSRQSARHGWIRLLTLGREPNRRVCRQDTRACEDGRDGLQTSAGRLEKPHCLLGADVEADGARKERAIQAELDKLAGTRSGAVATKKSKQDQIAGHFALTREGAQLKSRLISTIKSALLKQRSTRSLQSTSKSNSSKRKLPKQRNNGRSWSRISEMRNTTSNCERRTRRSDKRKRTRTRSRKSCHP